MGSVVVGRFLGTVVVTLHGHLDVVASVSMAGVLHDLIEGQGNLAVVVDLRDLHGIADSGVDVLAAAVGTIAMRGGELRLCGPAGLVFDALTSAGLASLVSIPFEEAHRSWSPGRRGASAHRAAMARHPAGWGRSGHDDSAGVL